MQIIKGEHRSVHAGRLEEWLGADRVEDLSKSCRDWYGPPISLLDVPGGVRLHGGGDFTGPFERGMFFSALDALDAHVKRMARQSRNGRMQAITTLSGALASAAAGKRVTFGPIQKVGTAPGATGAAATLWFVGNQPAAGSAAGAAPTGTTPDDTTTGAFPFTNPTGGEFTHLQGADMSANAASMAMLLYDRLFSVTKTMNSTSTEAVTAATTRYNSTTPGAADYASGNFLMIECRSVLPATAHNWTTCLYTDQDGNTGATLPSVTGISSCAANRLDMPAGTWFCPLASGDSGIRALTQMQCSAAVASGNIDFTMGHPLGIMAFPLANFLYPYDWITNRDLLPRIMDNACLAMLHMPCSASTATTFVGSFYAVKG